MGSFSELFVLHKEKHDMNFNKHDSVVISLKNKDAISYGTILIFKFFLGYMKSIIIFSAIGF